VRIKVHPALCNGWGECHRWGREVYPLDEEGLCEIRLLEVPPELEAQARLGASACPEQAITVIEDHPGVPARPSVGAADEVPVGLAGRGLQPAGSGRSQD
jgi:ferredoxin